MLGSVFSSELELADSTPLFTFLFGNPKEI